MKALARVLLVLRHFWRVWRDGQVRFRLETFGVYFPALPYEAPWWRVSPQNFWLLLKRMPAYARWIEEMHTIRRLGGAGWWGDDLPDSLPDD
jgi:hypothetical protein